MMNIDDARQRRLSNLKLKYLEMIHGDSGMIDRFRQLILEAETGAFDDDARRRDFIKHMHSCLEVYIERHTVSLGMYTTMCGVFDTL